jgi:hypothetical protein
MSQGALNFTQVVQKYRQNIMFLGSKNIQKGTHYSWKEFIDDNRSKQSQIGVIKIALDIYNGELKGFAGVPDEKDIREGLLKNYMKDLIKSTIPEIVLKKKDAKTPEVKNMLVKAQDKEEINSNKKVKDTSKLEIYDVETLAINVAI